MKLPKLSKRRLIAAAILIGLIWLAVAHWASHTKHKELTSDVDTLIELLSEPENKVQVVGHIVPGGEILKYSPPMEKLIALGDAAREPSHQRLGDERIQNEIVLVLGAIGDDSTVPLLIDAYPDSVVQREPPDSARTDPVRLKLICFSHALTYLTHEGISRSRWGTDFTPGNRKKWQEWWAKNHRVFWVTGEPGRATYIPGNPPSPRTLKSVPQILAQLNLALQDADAEVRTAAAKRLAHVGPNAKGSVPNLIVALGDKDARVREAAANTFYFIGSSGEEAVPALLEAMRHDEVSNVRSNAALSLAKVGAPAIPHLLEALRDKDAEVRRLAAWSLGEHNPKRKDVLPALQTASKDTDPNVREYALSSMGIIDSENSDVFRALLAGLEDPSPVVRRGCAYDFWRMGPRAQSAAKPLIGLLEDHDLGVRREAMNALLKIGSLTREHVPLLTKLLKDETWEVRSSAAEALGKIGPQAKAAVESLRETLRDPHPQVRWWSADALGNIGPGAKPAIPDLIKALRDKEDLVRTLAREALQKIDPTGAAR
jgi:HEAT repeat protein